MDTLLKRQILLSRIKTTLLILISCLFWITYSRSVSTLCALRNLSHCTCYVRPSPLHFSSPSQWERKTKVLLKPPDSTCIRLECFNTSDSE